MDKTKMIHGSERGHGGIKMTPAAVKILETASHLFYWKGINAVGVETIASEAGVTKKTLYDRFGSKDQLIVAYLAHRDEQWKTHLHQSLANVPANEPLHKILRIFDALGSWLAMNHQRGCAFINALAELTDESHPGRMLIFEEKKWLKQLFADWLTQAGVEEAEAKSEKLLILHEGGTVAYSMNLSTDVVTTLKETAMSIIGETEK
ncbi:TetR/AcrR family transcriptional regulator [Marinicrinis sediminis]|uniref:TetR/AcrR family transcriptional regulator n=1 Tax=Marinicrinis sediminis TaxID=1652465 RepID=A0ABW5R8E1_9BACL